jgi:hypothetical protein
MHFQSGLETIRQPVDGSRFWGAIPATFIKSVYDRYRVIPGYASTMFIPYLL